jgi:penicillin-binding protein 1A
MPRTITDPQPTWGHESLGRRTPARPAAAPPRRRPLAARVLAWAVAAVVVYSAAAWTGTRLAHALMADQPVIRDPQRYTYSLSSKVLSGDGTLIYTFAEEKRDYVPYAEISPLVVQGLVAVEDEQFWTHRGINVQGIARAAWTDVKASAAAGRLVFPEGGSSITQQLTKRLFLTPEKTISRKVREWLLAVHVEKTFRKEEILEMYLNQVAFGHNRHGVEAASQFYFGKRAKDLTLPEAALVAGLPQRPSASSPRTNPAAALARRNHVLDRMAACGTITREQAAEAKAQPIQLASTEAKARLQTQQAAPFFVEDIRRTLVERVGDQVNTGGLEIETTLDMELQRQATRAVRNGLRRLDRELHGFRGVTRNLVADGIDPDTFEHPLWLIPPEVDGVTPGVVLEVGPRRALVRVGNERVEIGPEAIAWTRRQGLASVLKRGDVAPFRVTPQLAGGPPRLELEQDPELEASLVAIHVPTGEIRALVGGYDYDRSEFNKVTQAKRQAGSAFKPIYYASALEQGLSPATTVVDEPTIFIDPWTGDRYEPENYYKDYGGRVTLREALERSLNIGSVRLLNLAGYDHAIALAKSFGITAPLRPYPSLALGSMEVTLLELTSAYAVFPSMGMRLDPTLIRRVKDAKGNVVMDHAPAGENVLSEQTAFQMVQLLRGVIQSGTGKAARGLGRPLGGKTGTTDDYSNAWFVGFTPSLCVGVWVGYEKDIKSIGEKQSGAVAALPIWIDFMAEALRDQPVEQFQPPSGIEFVAIDRQTGLRASSACPSEHVFLEAFRANEQPLVSCAPSYHLRLTLPMPLQRFDVEPDGALIVPNERVLLQLEEEAGGGRFVVDPFQRALVLPSLPGGPPRVVRYDFEAARPGRRGPPTSIEELMARDPRQLVRTVSEGLRDFDVLDGKTVIVVRNEDSGTR